MTLLEKVVKERRKLRPTTKAQYLRCIASYVAFIGTDARRWTHDSVEAWRSALEHHRKSDGKALSIAQLNLHLAAVKTASRLYFEHGYGKDFAAYVEGLSDTKGKTREAFTLDEVKKLIAACQGTTLADVRDRAIVTVFARTGMRRGGHAADDGEDHGLLGIKFEDIDGHKRTVTIGLKGGKRHTVRLDDETWEVLKAWCDRLRKQGCNEGYIFRGTVERVSGDDIRLTPLGQAGLHAVIKRRARQAGVTNAFAHRFRHFLVSYLRSIGVPDWEISLLTGHRMLPGGQVPSLQGYTSDLSNEAIGAKIPSLV